MNHTESTHLKDEQGNTMPTLSAPAPDHYLMLDEIQKEDVILESDHCIISHPDHSDCFIRTYLIQKLSDSSEILEYGVWVSISKENLIKYLKGTIGEKIFAGYLCTQVSPYQDVYQIRMNVIVSDQDQVPESVPQEYQADVPFVRDYYEGITKQEAIDRVKKIYKQ